MGRYSTGAITINSAQRIELSWLKKQFNFKYLGKNFEIYGYNKQAVSWNNGGKIDVEVHNTRDGLFMVLSYVIAAQNGEKTDMVYYVQIELKTSNLGAGKVLYFRCPVSNNLCRTLYRAYGSHYFKSRKAYKHRLYYPVQMASKKYVLFHRLLSASDKLETLPATRKQTTFKGKPTKRYMRDEALFNKYFELENFADGFWLQNFMK